MIGFTRIVNGDVLTQQSLRDFPTILLSFLHFLLFLGGIPCFKDNSRKRFREVSGGSISKETESGKLLLECVVEEHLYKAKIR